MPTKIGERIATALQNNRISQPEMTEIINLAKAEKKFTPALKAELSALISQHSDKFTSSTRASLERFLNTTSTVTELADPTVLTKHNTSVSWTPVQPGGALFVDGISYDDVIQGSIANCYMVSAFSSLAQQNPDAIKNAIRQNADGTYDVRFFEKSGYNSYRPVTVKVDGDLPTEFGTTAKYGKARDPKEQWITVLEKAYAQWKGGYEAIGNGGNAGTVFEALTGKPPSWTSTSSSTPDQVFSRLSTAISTGKPVTAGTHGKDSGVDYNGTGVYAWHAYTVLGTSTEGTQKYVELRNPWGRSEHGSDGKDDGIFKMKLEDFVKLYNSINIGG
ncbi:MAG: C2 family cysteine protease [Archangium sp.]